MNVLRNGWTWCAVLLVLGWVNWPNPDPPLLQCQNTLMATQAQRDGLGLQALLLEQERQRLTGEIVKANQWAAGMRRVVGQLELQCRMYRP